MSSYVKWESEKLNESVAARTYLRQQTDEGKGVGGEENETVGEDD